MSYRDSRSADNLFAKTNRNDRYKQMTKQQQLIEEKKRQIQEKLEQQKRKDAEEALKKAAPSDVKTESKSLVFSNDGSFLDQFKKISGLSGSQSANLNNGNLSESQKSDSENNQNKNEGVHSAPTSELSQPSGVGPVTQPPPPFPPDPRLMPPFPMQPPQQHFQPPPHLFPFGIPPPPPPVSMPPPLIPQGVPPPMPPQSIPPPGPLNVQNIPPPPLGVPPPPLPPCFPPVSNQLPPPQFQPPPHPGPPPPMPNLLLPPPNFNRPPVPPENVQQGNPQGHGAANGPGPQGCYSPTQQSPDQCPPNMNNWFPPPNQQPPRPLLENRNNNSSPSSNDQKVPEIKQEIKHEPETEQQKAQRSERKRKSRWSDEKEVNIKPVEVVATVPKINVTGMSGHMLTKVTRTDPGLLQYALTAYGSTHLTEEDWKKAEENYKVHLLYQDMMAKRAAVEKLREAGKNKYEYDSDEEIDEKGTWEHKLRDKEMVATQEWAESLTEMAKGKHHIGDFLPPDELKKFMAKYQAVKGGKEPDLSDYKEYKLGEENKGFQMLQKLGWSEGQGLGSDGAGRLDPINKGQMREFNEGLGHTRPDDITTGDDEYDAYRKRMMLAYRFRPNPLNNPRRPYY